MQRLPAQGRLRRGPLHRTGARDRFFLTVFDRFVLTVFPLGSVAQHRPRAALQNWRDSEPRGFFESSPPERQRIIAGHRELWAECVAEIDASPDGTTEWGSVSDAE